MLLQYKNQLHREDLVKANFGIERESLRVTPDGDLALTKHPDAFGDKMNHPYITTDFSESQVEMITPTFQTVEEVHEFLEALYQITVSELGEEYLWPQSMPCALTENQEIPIALFTNTEAGQQAMSYRQALLQKYGGKRQLISGIHYNFSFSDTLLQKLFEQQSLDDFQQFKDQIYLKVARNYIRYRWLLIYLLGASPIVDESYCTECHASSKEVAPHSYSKAGAVSFRNSLCGYQNKAPIYVDYSHIKAYVASLNQYIESGFISSFKEFYSPIRLKAKDPVQLMESLVEDGIQYVEIRSIDLNPFEKNGISLDDLHFIHLFILFLLNTTEDENVNWQQESLENERRVATMGLQSSLNLVRNNEEISLSVWAMSILDEMELINETFNLHQSAILAQKRKEIMAPNETISAKMINLVEKSDYVHANLSLARRYKDEALAVPYILAGYEDLELSTQILLKEAIKAGIKVDLLDRNENFIRLKANHREEYVQQATKTSLDSYSTVLALENKVVTKKVLEEGNIQVPQGGDYQSLDAAMKDYDRYHQQHIVIKPKSTNFGIGITMIERLSSKQQYEEALQIAFEHDQTVLVELFVQGNEYRFLVIEDEVVGVLQRIPANVVGDGIHTISQLIERKNEDPLRGSGYKRPLEKIRIDQSLLLYLKEQKLALDVVPPKGSRIQLRENSNISTGGDSVDMTDVMPQVYKDLAREATKKLNVAICGVDMIIEDYTNSSSNYAIIEMNFNPAIHIHTYPFIGTGRSIAKSILKALKFIS